MSNHIITTELFVELLTQQQELLVGGADFELAGSNYANRFTTLRGTTFSGPNGSFADSAGQTSAVNTAAQDLLGLGAPALPNVGALGAAPVLTGLPAGGLGGIGT